MRHIVYDANRVHEGTGQTITKMVRIATTNSAEAREFAEKFASENNLQIVDFRKAIHKWYTGFVGYSADFADK